MTDEKKIRVLVVDDDPHVRTVVVIHLRQLGFEVESANNGLHALSVLGEGAPELMGHEPYDADVILLDLLMPVMDGYDFLAKYEGSVPVIVMSGLGDIAALPRQPFALVVKPMSMITVADTLREAALRTHACPACLELCTCPEGNDLTPRRGGRVCVHDCEQREGDEADEQFLRLLPKCLKGACIAPATRTASYRTADGYVKQPSCDAHGGDPAEELPDAEKTREMALAVEAAGRQWWDIGCFKRNVK